MGGPTLFFLADEEPLKEMTRRVRRALGKADTRELLDTVGSQTVRTTQRRFDLGRDPDGGKWPVSLAARQEGRKTLIKTGRLKDSYTYVVAPDGRSVEIGSNAVYAAIHHFGGVIRARRAKFLHFKAGGKSVFRKSVNIPARPALGINAEDETHLLETVDDWIRLVLRHGLRQ